MKLERLADDRIPKDLSEHWQSLQDTAGAGHLHTDVGMKEEHQRLRLERVAELTVEYAKKGPNQWVLEMGCCEGAMTSLIAPGVEQVLAVDFVQSLLDECPVIQNVEYRLQDVATWGMELDDEGPWDVMVMAEILEHLEDPIGVLKRWQDLVYYVVASCPVNESLNHDTAWDMSKIDDLLTGRGPVSAGEGAGHIWAMDEEGFDSMFTQAGYEIVHTEMIWPSRIVVAAAP